MCGNLYRRMMILTLVLALGLGMPVYAWAGGPTSPAGQGTAFAPFGAWLDGLWAWLEAGWNGRGTLAAKEGPAADPNGPPTEGQALPPAGTLWDKEGPSPDPNGPPMEEQTSTGEGSPTAATPQRQ